MNKCPNDLNKVLINNKEKLIKRLGNLKPCIEWDFDSHDCHILGEGTYNIVYEANAILKINNKKIHTIIAIRESKELIKESNNKKIIELKNEIFDVVNLGNKEVSPVIYDAYFEKEDGYITRYILMEKFDLSLKELLDLNKNYKKKKFWNECAKKIIELIKRLSQEGYYCIDMKPRNCVYKKSTNTFRLIDFDKNGCLKKNLDNEEKSSIMIYILSIHLGYKYKGLNFLSKYSEIILNKHQFTLEYAFKMEELQKVCFHYFNTKDFSKLSEYALRD